MTYKRKKYHFGDTHLKKQWRTKRKTKDLDEVNFFLVTGECYFDRYNIACAGICSVQSIL